MRKKLAALMVLCLLINGSACLRTLEAGDFDVVHSLLKNQPLLAGFFATCTLPVTFASRLIQEEFPLMPSQGKAAPCKPEKKKKDASADSFFCQPLRGQSMNRGSFSPAPDRAVHEESAAMTRTSPVLIESGRHPPGRRGLFLIMLCMLCLAFARSSLPEAAAFARLLRT